MSETPWARLEHPAEEAVLKTHEVDVSRWLGEGIVFVWREPDIPQQFRAADDAAAIKKRKPAWTDLFCQIIALMGHSHQSPPAGDKPIIERYIAMVDHKDLFEHLLREFKAEFPHLLGISAEAVHEEKKD